MLFELYNQCGPTDWCWGNVSGTSSNYAPPADPGSPLSSLVDNTGRRHVYYFGSGGLLFELYNQCGPTDWCWGNVSVTSSNYAPPADPGSPLSSLVDNTGRRHVYYFGSGGLLFELYNQCGPTDWCWGNVSGTSSNYAPPADPGSPLSSLVDSTGRRHVYYFGSGGLLFELYNQCGPTDWCWGNVSGTSSNYAPPADPGSPLSSLVDNTGRRHVYYFGSGGLLFELYNQCGPTDWCWGNVSGTSSNYAPPAIVGSPLSIPIVIYGGDNELEKNFDLTWWQFPYGCHDEDDPGDVYLNGGFKLFGPNIGSVLPLLNLPGVVYDDGSVMVENLRKTDNDTLEVTKYADHVHYMVHLHACTGDGGAHRYIKIHVRGIN